MVVNDSLCRTLIAGLVTVIRGDFPFEDHVLSISHTYMYTHTSLLEEYILYTSSPAAMECLPLLFAMCNNVIQSTNDKGPAFVNGVPHH